MSRKTWLLLPIVVLGLVLPWLILRPRLPHRPGDDYYNLGVDRAISDMRIGMAEPDGEKDMASQFRTDPPMVSAYLAYGMFLPNGNPDPRGLPMFERLMRMDGIARERAVRSFTDGYVAGLEWARSHHIRMQTPPIEH